MKAVPLEMLVPETDMLPLPSRIPTTSQHTPKEMGSARSRLEMPVGASGHNEQRQEEKAGCTSS